MDNDCVKDMKCCSNGCYKICVSPSTTNGAAAGILLGAGIIPADWLRSCILYQKRNKKMNAIRRFKSYSEVNVVASASRENVLAELVTARVSC